MNRNNRMKVLLITAGVFILAGLISLHGAGNRALHDGLMIAATLLAGRDLAVKAWRGLMNRQMTIELLVAIAATGGLLLGIYWESAAVTFLFLLGGWLEARSMSRTRSTLKELLSLAPARAVLLTPKGEESVPAREVREGDLVLIRPGSRIPVDGMVELGRSVIDESSITGEPLPVEKQKGSEVFAGTLNQNGLLKVRATRAGRDTVLAKIIRRVEEAQEDKAGSQRLIERFATWYTPSIVGMSLVAFLYSGNAELSLTLLVIGCPGALVIATPVSIITGIGSAARKGILIKGGEHLENAGRITAVALDKTGTLTEGKPELTALLLPEPILVPGQETESVTGNVEGRLGRRAVRLELIGEHGMKGLSGDAGELLYWAGIAESGSEHPLALPVLDAAGTLHELPEPEQFEAVTGMGVRAWYRGREILVGRPELLKSFGVELDRDLLAQSLQLEEEGHTVMHASLDTEWIGSLGVSDPVREEAGEMVQELKRSGIRKVVMLTGDVQGTARAVAERTGIDEVHARMLPDEKLAAVARLQQEGHRVAMIGDGINDAPAVAHADIGIAMGVAGTDTAIETADIALMTDDLMKIPEAIRISRKTLRNIRQNVAIALLTVGLLLAGVVAGEVHMAGGMLVHELSVFAVILNALRLRRV